LVSADLSLFSVGGIQSSVAAPVVVVALTGVLPLLVDATVVPDPDVVVVVDLPRLDVKKSPPGQRYVSLTCDIKAAGCDPNYDKHCCLPVTPLSRACYSSRPEALRPRLTTGLPLRCEASKPEENNTRKRLFAQTVGCCNGQKGVSSHFGADLRRTICGACLNVRMPRRVRGDVQRVLTIESIFMSCSECAAGITRAGLAGSAKSPKVAIGAT
jgi:hypothetical protein